MLWPQGFISQLEQERQLFKDNSTINNILLALERRLFVAKVEVEKQCGIKKKSRSQDIIFAKGFY